MSTYEYEVWSRLTPNDDRYLETGGFMSFKDAKQHLDQLRASYPKESMPRFYIFRVTLTRSEYLEWIGPIDDEA